MKRKNKFEQLTPEDQQFILNLCAQTTYAKACEILARPRPEGLAFHTGISSLCRFCTTYDPDAAQTMSLGQYSKMLQVRKQADGAAHTEALLLLTQNRLLEALRNGKAIADLSKEFRAFWNTHKTFLAEHKWRSSLNDEQLRKDYWRYVEDAALTPQADFMRNDVEHDPGASEADALEFNTESEEELDIEDQRNDGRPRQVQLQQAKSRQLQALLASALGKKPAPTFEDVDPDPDSANSGIFHSNSPEIPHFPPNSISPDFAQNPPSPADHREDHMKE